MSLDNYGLPSPDQAVAHLFENVYVPVFFQKMASFGIIPENEHDAQVLLETAGRLKIMETMVPSPVQSEGSVYKEALDALSAAAPPEIASAAAEASLYKVAAELAADPTIFNSVLSLKAAEAQRIAAGL